MKKHNIYRLSGLLKARLKAMSLLITIMLPACSMGQSEQFNQYKQIAAEQHERYLKIDEKGQVLPKEASSWSCVYDNKTQLLWEEKTDDGGLRDKDWLYTFYDPDGWWKAKPADPGAIDAYGTGVEEVVHYVWIKNTRYTQVLKFNKNGDSAGGTLKNANTDAYAKAINQLKLCGLSSWRLPKPDEADTLLRGRRTPFEKTEGKLFYTLYKFEDKQNFVDAFNGKETMAFLDRTYFKWQPFYWDLWEDSFTHLPSSPSATLSDQSVGTKVTKENQSSIKNGCSCLGSIRLVAGK